MELKEKAKQFAIIAHKGQVRKSEPDKPMIIHPISVGLLLEQYGYSDPVVAAGYLHDVVEDTKYTFEDIKKEFGDKVANLVMTASEPDKTLSWEKRKKHTIENAKGLPLENKLVICADKINNLEDIMIKFQKEEKRDFSAFNRGEEKQKWYYKGIYQSLIQNENAELPIFKRLKEIINIVFENKEDLYLKNIIFDENADYYQKLKQLHAQKLELKRLKMLCELSKSIVIEFSGTPRTGKTTTINNLYDFFKKGGFSVVIIEEFTTSKHYKEYLKPTLDKMSLADSNFAILDYIHKQLEQALLQEKDIILIDRSINDRQIWNYRRYLRGDITKEAYYESQEKYHQISKALIDFLIVTTADPLVSLKRDYNSSLALEKRTFLNIENIEEYNKCLGGLKELFSSSVNKYIYLDTSSMNMQDVAITIASQILPTMRAKYLKKIKEKYN